MAYSVELKPSVLETLAKIPLTHRKRIGKKIDQLADDPRPRRVEKLSGGKNLYRIRSGDYRIIYEIHDKSLLVLVVRIGKRGDVYRHLP